MDKIFDNAAFHLRTALKLLEGDCPHAAMGWAKSADEEIKKAVLKRRENNKPVGVGEGWPV